MNLTVRSSLQGMIVHTSSLMTALDSSVDRSTEVCEALESLGAARTCGQSLINMINDLEVARSSLETNGFSDKWLDTINVDNRFVDAVNIDLVALSGTAEEKCDVAMEGILSTIWDYIKKIWNFIKDVFNKVVNFIRKILGFLHGDGTLAERAEKLIDQLRGNTDARVIDLLGDTFNSVGKGRGSDKNFDMRGLITRLDCARCLATYLCNNTKKDFGMSSSRNPVTGDGYFNATFEDYVLAGNNYMNKPNYVMKNLADAIERNPGKISENDPVIGFKDFSIVIQPSSLKDILKEAGFSIDVNDHEVIFRIAEIVGTIPEINYKAIYTNTDHYGAAIGAYRKIVANIIRNKTLDKIGNMAKEFSGFADDAYRFAEAHANQTNASHDPYERNEHSRLTKAFAAEGKWMLEVSQVITLLISTYTRANDYMIKFMAAFDKCAPQLKELLK